MHIEPEELMAYLDGELPMDQAGAAAMHLERCRDCQGLAADFQRVSRRLTEWQIEPSNVTAVWEPRENPAAAGRKWRGRWKPWVWGMAAVSMLALLLLSQNRTAYYQPALTPQAEFPSPLVPSTGP